MKQVPLLQLVRLCALLAFVIVALTPIAYAQQRSQPEQMRPIDPCPDCYPDPTPPPNPTPTPYTGPAAYGSVPFQSLWRSASDTYLYSKDENEIQNARSNEGYIYPYETNLNIIKAPDAGRIYFNQELGTVPLYRYSSSGYRFIWTTSQAEGASAAQVGYTHFDGIAGFVIPNTAPLQYSAPVYRYQKTNGSFYYTTVDQGDIVYVYDASGANRGEFSRRNGIAWYSPTIW